MNAVSQAGGNIGYLPRPHAYRHHAYEAANAYQWYRTAGCVLPGTEAAVRHHIAEAARSLWGGRTGRAILDP